MKTEQNPSYGGKIHLMEQRKKCKGPRRAAVDVGAQEVAAEEITGVTVRMAGVVVVVVVGEGHQMHHPLLRRCTSARSFDRPSTVTFLNFSIKWLEVTGDNDWML